MESIYKCVICFEEFSKEDEIVKPCAHKHIFCITCFHDYIQCQLNEDIDFQTFACPLCRTQSEYIKNGFITTYYENGNIRIRAYYTNNQLNGIYEEYYENGQKASQFNYVNGQMVGTRIEWYDNGNIWLKCFYGNHGKKEGLAEEYYENGQLWKRIMYIDGIRDGLYQEYDMNGRKIST